MMSGRTISDAGKIQTTSNLCFLLNRYDGNFEAAIAVWYATPGMLNLNLSNVVVKLYQKLPRIPKALLRSRVKLGSSRVAPKQK